MVNNDEFSNRLKIIMNHFNFSASSFAEKLDVQRSSISHLLSGRNKPSLDFVLKVLKGFPEVELYWLLNGVGTFPKSKIENTPTPSLQSETITKEIESNIEDKTIKQPELFANNLEEKEIERIVIFFKDGSFKNYTP
ncbi:helix-turn-helix domain-containing protein [Lutibacter citreus]|uniref:helix-turn-helix domain-containing protein n=1 Tax=Lutibacter citreus TaxID=2138210 RepID=UPI000DBE5F8D|nr:helix-turn-helix transcriptional regulator [Lutibacter citreus]